MQGHGMAGSTGSQGTQAQRPRTAWADTIDGQAVAFFSQYLNAINWAINDACVGQRHRDDVRQDIAVRIINRFRSKGAPDSVNHMGFAIRVARNACIDHFRRQPPLAGQVEQLPLADSELNPEQQLIRMQGHERLHAAIACLSPLKRHVVREVMRGKSLIDLAAELERSHSSLKVLHHRAVNELRKMLTR